MSWTLSKQTTIWRVALTFACIGLAQNPGRAQSVSVAGPSPDEGIAVAGWLFYPSFFAGAVFNDNVFLSAANRQADLGVRLRPSLEAVLDNGIHKFRASFSADAQVYPGLGSQGFTPLAANSFAPTTGATAPNNIQLRAGASHQYKPLEDLTVVSSVGFLRQIGLMGNGFASQPASLLTPVVTPVPTGIPQYYNQFSWATELEKKITERTFVRASGSITATLYDNPASTSAQILTASAAQSPTSPAVGGYSLIALQNGVTYNVGTRAGYWINSGVNAFAETSGAFIRYSDSRLNTNGFALLAGLATDETGLVKGQVYGGYRAQYGLDPRLGEIWAPTFGGRLLYLPTAYLTLAASFDQSLGGAAAVAVAPVIAFVPNTQVSAMTNVKALQARVQAEYAFSPYWRATLRGGYGLMRYTGLSRVDETWTAGFGVNYNFWRNILLTFDYQFSTIDSNVAAGPVVGSLNGALPSAYTQNLLTAGVTYRY